MHIDDVDNAYLKAESSLNSMSIGHLQYGVSSQAPVQSKELVSTCEDAWGWGCQFLGGLGLIETVKSCFLGMYKKNS